MKKSIALLLSFVLAAGTVLFSTGPVFAEEPADAQSYIFGTCKEYSTFTDDKLLEDTFYFSDGWFMEDPAERNDALALVSMQLTASAVEPSDSGTGASFLRSLGFEGIGFEGFDSDDPDDMAYTYASKQTADGDTIIAVAVQSYSLDNAIKRKGWMQNFMVNGEDAAGEHYALEKAAESALGKIAGLSDGISGNVKYWIMGHSRGGALTNLIAAKLPEVLGSKNQGIYAYTFEAPSTAQPAAGMDVESDFGYIHNYCCDDDIVPMVPPAKWGMKLYGKTYKLNTEEANAGMNAELEKISSDLKYSKDADTGRSAELIDKLTATIQTRGEYSEIREDTFTPLDGGEALTISYSYQDTLVRLMGIIFGKGVDVPGIADHLNDVLSALDPFIRGYMAEVGKYQAEGDIDAYYYKAAGDVYDKLDALDGETGNFAIDVGDLYVLLKLAAPVIIDTEAAKMSESCAITEDPLAPEAVMVYILPVLAIVSDTSGLTFSHQFDGAIARLKVLAPAPELEDISLDIDAPQAGDSVNKASKALPSTIDELGLTWLDGTAKWLTDDMYLKNNRKYYLAVTLYAAGHTGQENFKVTLGGNEPCEAPEISFKEGLMVVKAVFAYEFGNPAQYTVNFENDNGTVPEKMTVPAGTIMKYEAKPDAGQSAGYEFDDWYDYETPWDEVTVFNDKYLTAKWIKLIDRADISFSYPRDGQKLGAVNVPLNAQYHIESAAMVDEYYDEVETAKKNQELIIKLTISPNSKRARFVTEDGEFAGTFNINGKATDIFYNEDSGTLSAEISFTAKGKVNPITAKGKTVKVKYKKLKKKAVTIKRSKAIKISKAKGKVTYKKLSVGSSKINKKYGKKIIVNKSTGAIKVKKGLKKGIYKVKVQVRAAGNSTYEKSAAKTVTITLKVK